jgi:hypothetical protein
VGGEALRASLRRTQLDPRRARIRRGVLGVTLVIALLELVSILLEQHHTPRGDWHAIVDEENGLVALVFTCAIILALGLALRFGFAAGIVAGVVTWSSSIIIAGSIVLVHLLSDVTHNRHGHSALLGCLVLFALGIAVFVVELAIRSSQRHDDHSPALPTATVVD